MSGWEQVRPPAEPEAPGRKHPLWAVFLAFSVVLILAAVYLGFMANAVVEAFDWAWDLV